MIDVSDEEASSILSDSIPSGEFLSSFPTVQQPQHQQQDHLTLASSALTEQGELHSSSGDNHHAVTTTSKATTVARVTSSADIANVLLELQSSQATQKRLQSTLDILKVSSCFCQIYKVSRQIDSVLNCLQKNHPHSELGASANQ